MTGMSLARALICIGSIPLVQFPTTTGFLESAAEFEAMVARLQATVNGVDESVAAEAIKRHGQRAIDHAAMTGQVLS